MERSIGSVSVTDPQIFEFPPHTATFRIHVRNNGEMCSCPVYFGRHKHTLNAHAISL